MMSKDASPLLKTIQLLNNTGCSQLISCNCHGKLLCSVHLLSLNTELIKFETFKGVYFEYFPEMTDLPILVWTFIMHP